MPKILMVDDDFSATEIAECLADRGHEIRHVTDANVALRIIKSAPRFEVAIFDVMMKRPKGLSADETHGGRLTGLVLAKRLRQINPDILILLVTGSSEPAIARWAARLARTHVISKRSFADADGIADAVDRAISVSRRKPLSMIVHGHSDKLLLNLKNFIQNNLGLPEPLILREQPQQGRLIIEKFEDLAKTVSLVFVLMTPDDKVVGGRAANSVKRRARQNVIFELGYFYGALGRRSGRIMLLYKGVLELPSDIHGIVYIDVTKGIEHASEEIRRELRDVL